VANVRHAERRLAMLPVTSAPASATAARRHFVQLGRSLDQ